MSIDETLPEEPKKRGRKKKRQLIGQLGGGKNSLSGIVDIAIIQSLFEGEDKHVKELVADYGLVICDECHHVAAFSFEKVLMSGTAILTSCPLQNQRTLPSVSKARSWPGSCWIWRPAMNRGDFSFATR